MNLNSLFYEVRHREVRILIMLFSFIQYLSGMYDTPNTFPGVEYTEMNKASKKPDCVHLTF